MTDKKKPFVTPSNTKLGSVVDDRLRPDAEMHILVGGPYTKDGEEHRYGHAALRIKSPTYDLTYDFGRYGRVTGTFGESGDGILRIWTSFSTYIAGENSLYRTTTGFVYFLFSSQTDRSKTYFENLIAGASRYGTQNSSRSSYKLSTDYHALGPNCTTLTIDGAKQAVPRIDEGSSAYIKPEAVLTRSERLALSLSGGASRLFLPANLQEFLNKSYPIRVNRVDTHGGS